MGNLAIKVDNIWKRYEIGNKARPRSLRDMFGRLYAKPNNLPLDIGEAQINPEESFWALSDISFEVKHGEVVGLVGPNGAGKSTLLKVLSRIVRPSSGEARIWGRVGSLLEIGTGFHPELSGHENIFLNGAVIGMSRGEVVAKYDEIVEFSGVERFLHMPVKHYSSGMYIRLAFSVAVNLDPDVLFLDEVLTVGDTEFQRKSHEKLTGLINSGRTVVIVSHSATAIKTLCNRAIMLEGGRMVADGNIADVYREYNEYTLQAMHRNAGEAVWSNADTKPAKTHESELPQTPESELPQALEDGISQESHVLTAESPPQDVQAVNEAPKSDPVATAPTPHKAKDAHMRAVRIIQDGQTKKTVDIDRDFFVELEYEVLQEIKLNVGIQLLDETGIPFLSSPNYVSACRDEGEFHEQPYTPGIYTSRCRIPGNFLNDGIFSVNGILMIDNKFYFQTMSCADFNVFDTGVMRAEYKGPWSGVSIRPILGWGTSRVS
jgi:ABC-type polysaccharide/polyol phosphate transport system ATPase subunit